MFIDILCNSKAIQKLENAQGHQKIPVPCGFCMSPTCELSAQGWGYELATALPKLGQQHAFKVSLEIKAVLQF